MIEITDINSPEIYHYRNLRYTPLSHINEKIFIAEGEKVVKRLILSNLEIVSLFITNEFFEENKNVILSRIKNQENIFIARKELMNSIVGFNIHSGVMGMGKTPEDTEIHNLTFPALALNGIVNAENVGSIVRNCFAFGIKSVIIGEDSCTPWLRRSVRVSMGNIFDMNVLHSKDLFSTVLELKSLNKSIISAEITESSIPIYNFDFQKDTVIIFGSEGHGISDKILSISDYRLVIPIDEKTGSINVSSSSAIFLYEMSKNLSKLKTL